MSKVIINLDDGTVCDADTSVVVNIDALDDAGKAMWQDWLDSSSDHVAFELGEKYGEEVIDDERCIIKWSAEDVQQLKTDWSLEKCQEFLDRNSRHLTDRLIETGWEVLDALVNWE